MGVRGIVVALVACGCQQEKPAPVPVAARDAKPIDAAMFHDLTLGPRVERIPSTGLSVARNADPPSVWSLASEDSLTDDPRQIVFDGKIAAIASVGMRVASARVATIGADDQAWLIELAGSDTRERRAFIVMAPRGVGIDLHVGQVVHGELGWTDHPDGRDQHARIEDEDGIVVSFNSAEPAYRIGKKTTGFDVMGYEEAHEVEVNFGDNVWTPIAGWERKQGRRHELALYGLAKDLASDRYVTDYAGSTTFAMFRVPT